MRSVFLLFVIALIAQPVIAKPIGKASFSAQGEGLALDIEGTGGMVDADLKKAAGKVSGTFKVKVADFKTGIALRDEHFRKFLETDKFPFATFSLSEVEQKDGKTPFSGSLELHGKSAPFTGQAEFKGSQVSISGKLKLTDFGLTPPEYKLAKVSDVVEVKVEITL